MITEQSLPIVCNGHVIIKDDLGTVLVDKTNAVHPQNIARVIARALAHEDNYYIYRMAFGNGGTVVDAADTITYFTPHDGQSPDTNTWNSTLYNETYSEVVDDQSSLVSTGPGAVPSADPVSVPHVSGPGVRSLEAGFLSKVITECVLNAQEPTGQFVNDIVGTPGFPESDFTFDEIALFTAGLPLSPTQGYCDVNVGDKTINDDTGLFNSTPYLFNISVDGGAIQLVTVTTPAVGSGTGGAILFGDLITALTPLLSPLGVTVDISGGVSNTYGYLRFISNTTGATSSVTDLDDITSNGGITNPQWLFGNISGFVGGSGAFLEVSGQSGGVQNDPVNPTTEARRMLTHVIFSPVLKARNRTLTITYTLTISVARSM